MGGGLIQVQNIGTQDQYLTGSPEVTFFVESYTRHTNFAIESIQQTFMGTPRFGGKVPVVVSRTGDLAHKVYVEVLLPSITTSTGQVRWVDDLGCALVQQYDLEIGGSVIDKRYGKFRKIRSEQIYTSDKKVGLRKLWGQDTALVTAASTLPSKTIVFPLDYDFCEHIGLSLPMIALQYHETKITVQFNQLQNLLIFSGGASMSTINANAALDASMYVDYIYLDADERKAFAQSPQEYLFEQLQFTGASSYSQSNIKPQINFNHPCKEFIWVCQPQANVDAGRLFDFADGSAPYSTVNQLNTAKLQFNGQDRFSERTAQYFNQVQPYQYHTNFPATGIYSYSFAINPEEHQPSGSVNMSRIEQCTMIMSLINSSQILFEIYAINWNVLRIISGMGGLAYSS